MPLSSRVKKKVSPSECAKDGPVNGQSLRFETQLPSPERSYSLQPQALTGCEGEAIFGSSELYQLYIKIGTRERSPGMVMEWKKCPC